MGQLGVPCFGLYSFLGIRNLNAIAGKFPIEPKSCIVNVFLIASPDEREARPFSIWSSRFTSFSFHVGVRHGAYSCMWQLGA